MLGEEIKWSSQNVRRGAKTTLVFRVIISLVVIGLLVALGVVSSKLQENRGELDGLRESIATLPEPTIPTVNPQWEKDAAELKRVSADLEGVKTDLQAALEKSRQDLNMAERAAATERLKLTGDFARILARMGSPREDLEPLLAELPDEVRQGLLADLEAVKEGTRVTPVVPPVPTTEEDHPEPVPEPVPGPEPTPPPVVVPAPVEDEDPPVVAEAVEMIEYEVKRGDTVSQIARRHDTSIQEVMDLNGISNPSKIRVGQVLKLPKK